MDLRNNIHNFFIKRAVVLLLVIPLALLAIYGYGLYKKSQIGSYDGCVAAGLQVQNSNPSKCVVNGKTFSKEKSLPIVKPAEIKTVSEPIDNPVSRITKKLFGTYVTPAKSLVQPEKFTGFHTGTDFEATISEANTPIPTKAICDGTVRYKGIVDGYGGVVILGCTISEQVVTVLYGHVDVTSATFSNGDTVVRGDFVANLGAGYSTQTAGERKHLHLGIHIGSGIECRGYVQNQRELAGWLNYQDLYK